MATVIRAEISQKNKYWIDKHRHYELKHFCLQYPTWKKAYVAVIELSAASTSVSEVFSTAEPSDITAKCAIQKACLSEKINMIEQTVLEADPYLYEYLLKAVTEGLSYTYLRTKMNIPCGKDMFYDRYRKFFWLLSETRN